MADEGTIAQRVRVKFPGVYDDMNDQALEAAVLAKHPEYKDLPRTPAQATDPEASKLRVLGHEVTALPGWAKDAVIAYGKAGPGRVAEGFGEMAQGGWTNIKRGAHDVIAGVGVTALPMVAGRMLPGAIAAPLATAGTVATTVAGAGAGNLAAQGVTAAAGGDEDAQSLAGDFGAAVGGTAGAKLASWLSGPTGPDIAAILDRAGKMPDPILLKRLKAIPGMPDYVANAFSRTGKLWAAVKASPPTAVPGARLVPKPLPKVSFDDELSAALSEPDLQSAISIPDAGTGPSVTYSAAAKAARDMKPTNAPRVAMKPPSAEGGGLALGPVAKSRYLELARKVIRTPSEDQEFAHWDRLFKEAASKAGTYYAAVGKKK